MPVDIVITEEHVRYAESILLTDGKTFRDDKNERYTFIQNLETRDLQAVPGSGKTTALLAKLLILGKFFLPLDNGASILVVSHTNAAIDEIKTTLQKHCPELFEYPNYVGTIQSFVNEFLARPCGRNLLKTNFNWIDSQKFSAEIVKEYNFIKWSKEYDLPQSIFLPRFLSRAVDEAFSWHSITPFYNENITKKSINKIIEEILKNKTLKLQQKIDKINLDLNTLIASRSSQKIIFCDKKKYDLIFEELVTKMINYIQLDYINACIRDGEDNILVKEKSAKNVINKKFLGIKSAFEKVLDKGIISYKYAYHLGEYYLHQYPNTVNLLRLRFQYIFVDEMQDMDKHQHDILEKLFFSQGNLRNTFQRIGDVNQSIYGKVKAENYWQNRNSLHLSGSYRLSKQVGELVNRFAVLQQPAFKIEGLHNSGIPPHIIVYDNSTRHNIIDKYAQLIKAHRASGQFPFPPELKHPIKAVSWNTNWRDEEKRVNENKLRLEDFYPEYLKQISISKESYDTLILYLIFYDDRKKTLGAIRKSILGAIVALLNIEKKYDENNRHFTIRKFLNYVEEHDSLHNTEYYEDFNLNLFQWCISIIKNKPKEVLFAMQKYLMSFFTNLFNHPNLTPEGKAFLHNNEFIKKKLPDAETEPENILRLPNKYVDIKNNISIDISSVHSVKGQTHAATLYFESSYHDEYESERLIEQFLGNNFKDQRVIHKESAKMIYVGFSRPTHLLCFAVHMQRFEQHKSFFEDRKNNWKIEYCGK